MKMNIGIIGADSFHVSAFVTLLFEDQSFRSQFESISIYIDKTSDMKLSVDRQSMIIEKLSSYDINWVNNIESLLDSDAYMILSVDANTHLPHFKSLMDQGKPIFIDKPLTYNIEEAQEIEQLMLESKTEVFSSSALRFSPFLEKAKKASEVCFDLIELSGPLLFQEEIEGYYWYGIHMLDMLGIFGNEFKIHSIHRDEFKESIEGSVDGKLFNMVGHLNGEYEFKARIGKDVFSQNQDEKDFYYYLLNEIMCFFHSNKAPISINKTLTTLCLIEEINVLRKDF